LAAEAEGLFLKALGLESEEQAMELAGALLQEVLLAAENHLQQVEEAVQEAQVFVHWLELATTRHLMLETAQQVARVVQEFGIGDLVALLEEQVLMALEVVEVVEVQVTLQPI
jgi:hypothetical protein